MALKVVVTKGDVLTANTRTGVSSKTGRDFSMRTQRVRVFVDEDFPDKFTITLPDGVSHYSAGEYIFDVESHIDRGSFDSLAFVRSITLQPSEDKAKAGKAVFFEVSPQSAAPNALKRPFIPQTPAVPA